MKNLFALSALLFLGFSCAMPQTKTDSAATPAKEEKDEAAKKRKKEDLMRKIEIAKMRLEIAKTSQKNQEIESEISIARAKIEREFAERALKQFTDVDLPRRLEETRLGLQQTRDSLQDAKEELAQLEDMYKDGDLADKTREIVLQRGKRRVDRMTKHLALQEIEAQSVERFRLPMEREKLALSHKEKSDALAKAERDAAKAKAEQIVGVKEAEGALLRLENELADLAKDEAKP